MKRPDASFPKTTATDNHTQWVTTPPMNRTTVGRETLWDVDRAMLVPNNPITLRCRVCDPYGHRGDLVGQARVWHGPSLADAEECGLLEHAMNGGLGDAALWEVHAAYADGRIPDPPSQWGLTLVKRRRVGADATEREKLLSRSMYEPQIDVVAASDPIRFLCRRRHQLSIDATQLIAKARRLLDDTQTRVVTIGAT